MKRNFHIIANAALGEGLSGSDRIFIEFAKRLKKNHKVIIHVWEEGYRMCKREKLDGVEFKIINVNFWCKLGFLICYIARIVIACIDAIKLTISDPESSVVYSASEFWMDSFPAWIIKFRYPKVKWVAAWFQTAPNPIQGFTEGKRQNTYKLSAFLYWFMQLPAKPLISRFADVVLVNNDLEKKQFKRLNQLNKVGVILGAVNIEEINKYQKGHPGNKLYDGVFQGRFHPQKGVLELIDIWKLVNKQKPNAKLVMIGDGPLMSDVKKIVKSEKLENNVILTGYLFDGPEKYRIFSQSKVVLHPAFYDSGGMAAAEAMAFGLPCVGFDLPSYKSYYPKGMIKVKIGDLQGFTDAIIDLLDNPGKRSKLGKEAQEMIEQNWSWDNRISLLMEKLQYI